MNRSIVLALCALSALVVACEEPKSQTGGTTGAAQAPAPVVLDDKDIPTAADYDDQAEKDISATNYKNELDTLEKEITSQD
ncbi:hypothetical protein [Polyangium jinanense]|uniref:Lipoprotein n=1 Tax=Polyangium jinanense TaxID=2829994 RepID=A0A9X3X0P6_9BACT|nr:hypothetical protein [Polyangium jinanense]MDC3953032.1 hypothetical protein [Polyangium jinanense]MDC3980650.1 hypothetical protein [Polyangium jinanense]